MCKFVPSNLKNYQMKKFLLTVVSVLCVTLSYAGGLLTNTNQSAHFLRNPARGASMEIDAVYTNPAGLAFLKNDGLQFSLNNQSAFQTRTITSTFAPFALNGGSETKAFKGTAEAPFIPSLMAAYKTGNWVFSGSFAIVGGGGTLVFKDGLPSFEALVASELAAPIMQLSQASGLPAGYSLDMRLEGSSITYGAQLGATYKINDLFSAYIGARLNIVNNSYEGYLNNVQIANAANLRTYFTTAAATASGVASSLQSAIDGGYGNAPLGAIGLPEAQIAQMAAGLKMTSEEISDLSVSTVQGEFNNVATQANGAVAGVNQLEAGATATNMQVDTKQTGIGVTPIIGFNFNWEKLNIGVKYEFITKINLENDTKDGKDAGMPDFKDGVKTPYDIPALLTIGAQYDVCPSVTISAGYHHFFDSNAKMANNKQKYINGGMNEFLLGAEWRINETFLISAGGQLSRTGVTDNYQSDLSYSLNSYSIGFGGAINVTEKVRINVAYLWTNYEDWTKKSEYMTDVFSRTNNAFAIGVDFRF